MNPHLWRLDVHIDVKIVETRRVRSGANFKGGVSSWGQIARDLKLLLGDSGAVAVTTLLDYYGLPTDVPGMSTRPAGTADVKATHVEASMDVAVANNRLRSNLLLHEFEALLYSDPAVCGAYLGNARPTEAMVAAVGTCGGPELVNDDPSHVPSKRIISAPAAFSKSLDGPSIAEEIGIASIRAACPHFDQWLRWLESL